MPVALINHSDPKMPGGRFDLNIDDLESLASIIHRALPDQDIRWQAKNVHRKEFAMSGAADIAELRQPVKQVEIIAGYRFSITMSRMLGVICSYYGWGRCPMPTSTRSQGHQCLSYSSPSSLLVVLAVVDGHPHVRAAHFRVVRHFRLCIEALGDPRHRQLARPRPVPPLCVLVHLLLYADERRCSQARTARRPAGAEMELTVGIVGLCIGALGLVAAVVVPLALR